MCLLGTVKVNLKKFIKKKSKVILQQVMYDEAAWNFGLDASIFLLLFFAIQFLLMFLLCLQIIKEEYGPTIACTIRSFVTRYVHVLFRYALVTFRFCFRTTI